MRSLLTNVGDKLGQAVVTVCLAVVMSVAVIKYVPGLVPTQGVVVLDAIRLNNAFRQAAAPLIGKDQEGREVTAMDLSITGKRTLDVIRKVSGGQLVLIKQATVGDSSLVDITGDVIAELGLKEGSATPLEDPDVTIEKLKRYSSRDANQSAETQKWQDRVLP